MVVRFGDALVELVAIECGKNPKKLATRQWVRNNTTTAKRQISHAIAVSRHRQFVSQAKLAARLGWPRWMVTEIENCRRYCHPKKVRQIAAALGDESLNQLLDHYGW